MNVLEFSLKLEVSDHNSFSVLSPYFASLRVMTEKKILILDHGSSS